jgi:hypothetical protein
MQKITRAGGAGRAKLTLKLVSAPALFTLFVCGGFGYKNNEGKKSNKNKNKNKTLNSKTFK